MSEGKKRYYVVGGALVILGGVTFWFARWYVFESRISNVLQALPDKPTTPQLVAVPGQIRAQARSLWMAPESIALRITLEPHVSNGFASKEDMTQPYWFVEVHAERGRQTADWEKRIDVPVQDDQIPALEAGGLVVKKPQKAEGN